jgi:sulfur carrier protein
MQVMVNGQPREIPDGLTVSALIEHLGLIQGPVAVEINRTIIPRAFHPEKRVEANDVIEIVHFVGGG